MSAFPRFLPASRRFYSSFSSSKSGGGRYFNSTRASKTPVIASARSKGSPPGSASRPSDGSKGSQDGSASSKDVNHAQSGENAPEVVDAQSGTPANSAHSSSPSGEPGSTAASQGDSRIYNTPAPPASNEETITASWLLPPHPTVNSTDFKLHQFFSLHRPLLLLSNPSLILHPAPPSNPILTVPEESDQPLFTSDTSSLPSPPPNLLSAAYSSNSVANAYYDIPETSPDADAEAARQLARALALTRAGAMVEWEETLRALGLDVEMDPERVMMREQMERELEEVMMDSTKRKRRKKMKKHKLKKRRRLTRATRLKIGR